MTVDLAPILGNYAVAPLKFDDAVITASKRRLLDTIGCALAAHHVDTVLMARAYALSHGGDGSSLVWGTGKRASTEAAVFANTAAVRILDYNDAYLGQENLHPSDVIPALLAVAAQRDVTGRRLLEAIAVSYEVGITLCDAFSLRDRGWDHVAITRFAGICGVSRLLELTVTQVVNALAISAVAHNATRQSRSGDLSMWKGLAAADAMKCAVYAAQLACAGLEGPFGAFVGTHGFNNQILEGSEPDAAVVGPLMKRSSPHRVQESHLKLMPFAYAGHSAAEAAATIGRKVDLSLSVVESVQVETYDVAHRIMAQPESWNPTTRETADHSIPYVVAYALFNGDVDGRAFDVSEYGRPDYREFMAEKVHVDSSDELSARFPAQLPSRVRVRTTSGEEFVEETTVPYGHASRPPSDEDLLAKFHENCRYFGSPFADALVEHVEGLDSADSVAGLMDLLGEPPTADAGL